MSNKVNGNKPKERIVKDKMNLADKIPVVTKEQIKMSRKEFLNKEIKLTQNEINIGFLKVQGVALGNAMRVRKLSDEEAEIIENLLMNLYQKELPKCDTYNKYNFTVNNAINQVNMIFNTIEYGTKD